MKSVSEKLKKISVVDVLLIVIALYAMYMLYNCTMNNKELMEVDNMYYLNKSKESAPVAPPADAARKQRSCGAGNFVSTSLLPKTNDVIRKDGFEFAPKDLQGINFLDAKDKIGVDTVGNSLRNANLSIRDEPANPKTAVSPWMNSTIDPDLTRLSL